MELWLALIGNKPLQVRLRDVVVVAGSHWSGQLFTVAKRSFADIPRYPRGRVHGPDMDGRPLTKDRTRIISKVSYSGRRSFIATLASKGIGIRVLAPLEGHRSITTTQAYIDGRYAMKRATVELIV